MQTIEKLKSKIVSLIAEPIQFEIIEACNTKNNGVLKLNPDLTCSELNGLARQSYQNSADDELIAFIPAAGAASRFKKPFDPYIEALDNENMADIDVLGKEWVNHAKGEIPLSEFLKMALASPEFAIANKEKLKSELSLPKALWVGCIEDLTFFELKFLEIHLLETIKNVVFIVPENQVDVFENFLERLKKTEKLKKYGVDLGRMNVVFIEQSGKMQTTRFDEDIEPFPAQMGKGNGENRSDPYVKVPGGHGSLIHTFPTVEQKVKGNGPKKLFIKNVDNMSGLGKSQLVESKSIIAFSDIVQSHLTKMRTIATLSGQKEKVDALEETAHDLLQFISSSCLNFNKNYVIGSGDSDSIESASKSTGSGENLSNAKILPTVSCDGISLRAFSQLLHRVFHRFIPKSDFTWAEISTLLAAPLSVLGQVQREPEDIGGMPLFINRDGQLIKICAELPHINQKKYAEELYDLNKFSHFNPVYVFTELPVDSSYYLDKEVFPIACQKTWKAKKSFHLESLLYEILSDSRYNNCIFIEIDRQLFKPAKSIYDIKNFSIAEDLNSLQS